MFVVPNRNCEPLLLSLTADEADANDYIDDNNDRRNAMQWKAPPSQPDIIYLLEKLISMLKCGGFMESNHVNVF